MNKDESTSTLNYYGSGIKTTKWVYFYTFWVRYRPSGYQWAALRVVHHCESVFSNVYTAIVLSSHISIVAHNYTSGRRRRHFSLPLRSFFLYLLHVQYSNIDHSKRWVHVCVRAILFFASSWRILAKLPVLLFCFVLTVQCMNIEHVSSYHTNTCDACAPAYTIIPQKKRLPSALESTLGSDVGACWQSVHQCKIRRSFVVFSKS